MTVFQESWLRGVVSCASMSHLCFYLPDHMPSPAYFRDNIPKYWIWFYYLSIFKYPLQMFFVNEFDSLPNQCWYISENVPCATSQQVLAQFNLQGESYWMPAVVMVSFALGYRILFYILLKIKTSNLRS